MRLWNFETKNLKVSVVIFFYSPLFKNFNIVLQRGYHHARRPNKMNKIENKIKYNK